MNPQDEADRRLDEEALALLRAASGEAFRVFPAQEGVADFWRRAAVKARELHLPAPEPMPEHWEIVPRPNEIPSKRVLLLNHDRRLAWPFANEHAARTGLEYLRDHPHDGYSFPFKHYGL